MSMLNFKILLMSAAVRPTASACSCEGACGAAPPLVHCRCCRACCRAAPSRAASDGVLLVECPAAR